MSQPVLEVKNLHIEFPTRRGVLNAVDDVSFSIAPGEVLGVVGEAGANIDEVHHQRAFTTLSVQNVDIELVIQTRGRDHLAAVLAALVAAGFQCEEQK